MKITIRIANDEVEATTELKLFKDFDAVSKEKKLKHLNAKMKESLEKFYEGVEMLSDDD